MITEMDICFHVVCCMDFHNGSIIKRRDYINKLYSETVTPISSKTGEYGKPQTTYYIDDDVREFNDIDSLIQAYNKIYKHSEDNPETEIVYVKTIRKRK